MLNKLMEFGARLHGSRRLQIFVGLAAIGAVALAVGLRLAWSSPLTVQPRRGPLIEAVYGIGTVRSARVYHLQIGISSSVDRLFVREGDLVEAQTQLIKLNDLPVFRAPFAGLVTSLPFSEGETIFPQVRILELVDPVDRYLEVALEQEGILRVRRGQPARFRFESLRGERFEGKVRSVFPGEGQFLVQIEQEGLPAEVLPGMTADVAIEVSRKEDVLLIPMNAIDAGRVRILREGKRKKIDVRIGAVDGAWAEVLSGDLKADDEIILKQAEAPRDSSASPF